MRKGHQNIFISDWHVNPQLYSYPQITMSVYLPISQVCFVLLDTPLWKMHKPKLGNGKLHIWKMETWVKSAIASACTQVWMCLLTEIIIYTEENPKSLLNSSYSMVRVGRSTLYIRNVKSTRLTSYSFTNIVALFPPFYAGYLLRYNVYCILGL